MATSWLAAERSGISGVDGTGETGTLPARGAAGAGLPARRAPDHRRYSRAGGLRLRGDRRPPARSGAPAGRVGPLSERSIAVALQEDSPPGELTLRRILQTVVDSFGVEEAADGRIVVRLEKLRGPA